MKLFKRIFLEEYIRRYFLYGYIRKYLFKWTILENGPQMDIYRGINIFKFIFSYLKEMSGKI